MVKSVLPSTAFFTVAGSHPILFLLTKATPQHKRQSRRPQRFGPFKQKKTGVRLFRSTAVNYRKTQRVFALAAF